MKKMLLNRFVSFSFILLCGIALGWLFFHSATSNEIPIETAKLELPVFTCAMHPQIRKNEQGKCPLCGMDLIVLNQNTGALDPESIVMTEEAAQLANIQTTVVSKQNPIKEVRLYGKVQADERRIQSQVSYLPGRIEKLFVNFTGEAVRKGQALALIYSPDLVTAQQELLETAKSKHAQPALYEASKDKLRQWKLSEKQIASIESSDKVKTEFEVYANTNGIVSARRVNNGDYISPGTVLFEVADLSNVWVMFDAYESDLPFLALNQTVNFTIEAIPGSDFAGRITFIDPVLDAINRVARVRVEFSNEEGKLKPEMFATGLVKANLDVYKDKMVIPKTAVLWTGKRSVIYVKQSGNTEPVFKIRVVELGPMLGNSYVVENGLAEGEEIVTRGVFSIDASAQLEGKPSMLSQVEEKITATPVTHFQMNSLLDSYLNLKDLFIESDGEKIKNAISDVEASLAGLDAESKSDDIKNKWTDYSNKMHNNLKAIKTADKLAEQRKAFSGLSNEVYKAIKEFGLKGETVYYQYCPMAIKNKGAYWLSESKTIGNPYFGESMLDCGNTKETLRY